MSHDDFAVEPIPGLPGIPPEGEEILWQGKPDVWALARDAFSIRWVVGYFVLLAIWRAAVVAEFGSSGDIAIAVLWMAGLGGVACGLLWLAALIQSRATIYTITNRRVALRIGAALTITLNLPFRQLENASLGLSKDGTGTIALQMKPGARISYLVCWPHVRPWRMSRTEPALRSVPNAAAVAHILSQAAEMRVSEPELSLAPNATAAAVPAE